MIVAKFGGTSVSTAERIATIRDIIRERQKGGVVVVVSALAKVTDILLSIYREPKTASEGITKIRELHRALATALWNEAPESVMEYVDARLAEVAGLAKKRSKTKEMMDMIAAYGEIMSSYLVAEALKKEGVAAEQVVATELIVTDSTFGSAEFLPKETRKKASQRLTPLLKKGVVPVVTGFIGATASGKLTTLGRGGSDYTAAILGDALNAELIEIWTDVPGIMTTDPRIVPEARTVPELAFEEACELAYFGAKVLHPKTILPAIEKNIPVKVLNTLDPDNPGTTIVPNFAQRKLTSGAIDAISTRKSVVVIHVASPEFYDSNGLMVRLFRVCEEYWSSIEVVAVSVVSVSLAVDSENASIVAEKLGKLGTVTIENNKAVVCAVGGSAATAENAGKMFTTLGNAGIAVEMISQAAGGFSMTFVVAESDVERAISVLHKTYIEK